MQLKKKEQLKWKILMFFFFFFAQLIRILLGGMGLVINPSSEILFSQNPLHPAKCKITVTWIIMLSYILAQH